ncbi:E3 ubiquitin-protein ligase RKP-like [Chenopodium quinoa]|uniref:E3 ubiquitin-protein ligase RKP-like n=1 Tax=Chenopodium quinoa TaxID=63459 RepID=UPI000B772D49|nr:E3 ubiquitin-protein ligase RKP-like [Chenopodium quinoa]XP_021736631.1 E3 ubiquitin-protein ligase RKP-like [Chenopodium quinoa]
MAEDGVWGSGLSSGLALILNGEDKKANCQKNRLVSYHDDFGHQSLERTLEYIFDLPSRSIGPVSGSLDVTVVHSIVKRFLLKFPSSLSSQLQDRDGISIFDRGHGHIVSIDESSTCGDLRKVSLPLLLESLAIFSSARANACVWEGKWMYEVMLETAGIQQLGWATIYCPFTDRMGVGDAEDSYAFDGKRVKKWNEEDEGYGQPWVVGDVIGCCIDLDEDRILFYRNGISLGVAFSGIRKMNPGLGYFPAVSLSQGERCDLNFGARPFKYPIESFLPLQNPPPATSRASQLLQCLSRLLEIERMERAKFTSVDKLRRLQRFVPLDDIFHPVADAICDEFFSILDGDDRSLEYIAWGPLLSFLLDIYGLHLPHDHRSLDKVVDVFLKFRSSSLLFQHVIGALSYSCKTASLVLTECPYSGPYPYLALACHLLRREELMVLWWKSSEFEFLLEGFLSWKSPNKHDLQLMMPSVWWPNSCEDVSHESSMMLTTTALSDAISKIEEKHRDLCCLVIQFIPPVTPPQFPGSVFRKFLQNLLLKIGGSDRNMTPPGVLGNTVLVSLYAVILHYLSEGFPMAEICGWSKSHRDDAKEVVGFLHRGGQLSFPIELFVKNDPMRIDIPRIGGSFNNLLELHSVLDRESEVISWEEGCMDDKDTRVTHFTRQKPCCCSSYDVDFTRIYRDPIRFRAKGSRGHSSSIPERSSHVAAECSTGSLNEEIEDKSSSSEHPHSQFGYRSVQPSRTVPEGSNISSATLREEELLDVMLFLYHVGVSPNLRQASYYMSHQSQSISLLEETDRQIKERPCHEQQKRLKEGRNIYREEVIDCVRHSTWYRISLLSRWKQRGMYAACMWIVQLLLVVSKDDTLFSFVPEFYLEALVDCFNVLRKSDPPFVPSSIFIKQGLSSFVTFVVTHFNDPRISSADIKDLLLQSISALVQYKEYLVSFETNHAATHKMPKALLSAFDNRSWIPVTNILLRLCKGFGFGSSKHGETSSSSVVFQRLLRDVCAEDEELFAAFLNRLFNTLSWTMTEFSISIREMQEKNHVLEFRERKCGAVFDLSCKLARILEFCTHEIPQAFLLGNDMHLQRLTELVIFTLNQMTSATDSEFFDWSVKRHGQSPEKINRGMILAPLVGIIVNLVEASTEVESSEQNDIIEVLAKMDCPETVLFGLQYMLGFNWAGFSKGNVHFAKLRQLEEFLTCLISRMGSQDLETSTFLQESEFDDSMCCICYTSVADAQFVPCLHQSCYGCITRHLLNCQRCFFCNAIVVEVIKDETRTF